MSNKYISPTVYLYLGSPFQGRPPGSDDLRLRRRRCCFRRVRLRFQQSVSDSEAEEEASGREHRHGDDGRLHSYLLVRLRSRLSLRHRTADARYVMSVETYRVFLDVILIPS